MKFILKIAEFIEKLQILPEGKKKIILWTIVIILGLILSFFWVNISKERLEKINTKEIIKPLDVLIEKSQTPSGDEILEIQNSEELQELEKLLQEAQ